VDAGLKDRNLAGLLDRGWMLLKVRAVIEECAEMRTPAAGKTLIAAIRLMAQLQGELPFGRQGCRRPAEALSQPAGQSAAMERIKEILADANRLAAARAASTPPAAPPPIDTTVAEPVAAVGITATPDGPMPRQTELAAKMKELTGRPTAAPTPAAVAGDTTVSESAKPVVTTPTMPADKLPIGVVRPLAAVIRLPRPEAVEADHPAQAGPVIPRVYDGPVKYRSAASAYFMGLWG
jgi:hypothetical protein